MLVLCAWCCREGLPGYMGEREPLDNPGPTHGICQRHTAELLESVPPRPSDDAEVLIVVHREHAELHESFARFFAGTSSVKVIVDRRVAERRMVPGEESQERRHSRPRRVRDGTISPLGDITIVRLRPKRPTVPGPVGRR
jgi:hypothetical protein